MARPKKATVNYFPHTTAPGSTIFILQNQWGNDGYAAWFKILERLGATDGHYIDCRNVGTWRHLQAYTMVSEAVLSDILDTLSQLETIDSVLWSHKIIYCQHFIDNVCDAYRRRTDRIPTRGMVFAVTNCQDKEFLTAETLPKEVYAVRSTERKGKETKGKEIINTTMKLAEARDEFLRYSGRVMVGGGEVAFLQDIIKAYPRDSILAAFQAAIGKTNFLAYAKSCLEGKSKRQSEDDAMWAKLEAEEEARHANSGL